MTRTTPPAIATLSLAVLASLSLAAPPPPAPAGRAVAALPPAVVRAGDAMSGDRLRADVAFLADDRLEGRGTGTRGYELAARYVAARMGALGLEPGGTDDYLQPVPFRRAELDEDASAFALVRNGEESALAIGRDVIVSPDFLRTRWDTEAPLLFAGFGVSAPEMGYDDFAGLDATGKVVVEFRGAPAKFSANERAYYSSVQVKQENAAAHGAIGILTVRLPADEARAPWDKVLRQSRLPAYRWTDEGGAPSGVQPSIELGATLSHDAAEAAFAGAPRTLAQAFADADSSRPQGFALACSVKARRVTRHSSELSPNVIGVLRGSDPRLRDEAIVVSAHLDHLGISAPVAGDSINNGAYDNASGTAMMLEVARAFALLPVRPKRSLVFLSVTGEEKGLQGSDYFARHPAPLELTVVGDVNLDMVLMLRPVTQVIANGAEHSTLGPIYERMASLAGLTVVPDPSPEEVVFVRSDQFSFIRQGIPALFPVSNQDGTPESAQLLSRWRLDHYHSPSDDMNQPFDWASGARFTKAAFWTAWAAADAPRAPAWNDGDFFGRRFGPKR